MWRRNRPYRKRCGRCCCSRQAAKRLPSIRAEAMVRQRAVSALCDAKGWQDLTWVVPLAGSTCLDTGQPRPTGAQDNPGLGERIIGMRYDDLMKLLRRNAHAMRCSVATCLKCGD